MDLGMIEEAVKLSVRKELFGEAIYHFWINGMKSKKFVVQK